MRRIFTLVFLLPAAAIYIVGILADLGDIEPVCDWCNRALWEIWAEQARIKALGTGRAWLLDAAGWACFLAALVLFYLFLCP